jgi:hypothetical protein
MRSKSALSVTFVALILTISFLERELCGSEHWKREGRRIKREGGGGYEGKKEMEVKNEKWRTIKNENKRKEMGMKGEEKKIKNIEKRNEQEAKKVTE